MSLPGDLLDGANPIELDKEDIAPETIAVHCPVHDCPAAGDIILQAADGTKYGAHTKNCQRFSGGFPTPDAVVVNMEDAVLLSETLDVVRLMLGFMRYRPLPDLDCEPFKIVSKFAEAAEKYDIYSAMTVCKMQME